MNGQEKKLLSKMHSDLSHQMVELTTRFEERWDSHDRRSDERHETNCDKFGKIFHWLEGLPCKERKHLSTFIRWAYIWTFIVGSSICGLVLFLHGRG